MAEKVSNEQIEAFMAPLGEVLKRLNGENVVIIGVGKENQLLAETLKRSIDASAYSILSTDKTACDPSLCAESAIKAKLIIIITSEEGVQTESTTSKSAIKILRTPSDHVLVQDRLPGELSQDVGTLADRTVIINTGGKIQSSTYLTAAGGVIDFRGLNPGNDFKIGVEKIIGGK